MAAGPGPPPAEEEEAAAAAVAEAEAASRSVGHELGRCGRRPRARRRRLESESSQQLAAQSRLPVETRRIPGPNCQRPNRRARRAPRMRTHALDRVKWREGTHLGLHVPKDPSAAGGGAAIARPPGNVVPALERRQREV